MAKSEKQKISDIEYKKRMIKRIPLDVQISFYDRIKAAADHLGLPVNTYVKEAIQMRLDSESKDAK